MRMRSTLTSKNSNVSKIEISVSFLFLFIPAIIEHNSPMESQVNRYSSLHVGRSKTFRNRVVVPPMASGTATETGFVTIATIAHYQNLTRARPGLLTVEYTYVHKSGRSEKHQLGLTTDAHINGLTQIAAVIRSAGAAAGIQLTHAGGKSERRLTGGGLMGPSAIAVPVRDRVTEAAEPMSHADISLWKNAFVAAADRAVVAGFDLVELHAAHGYGLNQWLSPLTNQRDDEYGGDLQGRTRLLLEIVRLIRGRHPQLLVSVRMPGQDFIPGGLSIADAVNIAKSLEAAGVDVLSVSSGLGGWRRPELRTGEGYLVADAAQIQPHVRIPVIGVGGIVSGAFIDQALQQKYFSLAAVGRALLNSPGAWAESQLAALI
jgi:NADPH2 dehydrogenase